MSRRRGLGGARAALVFLLAVLVVVAATAYLSYSNPGGPASIISSLKSSSSSVEGVLVTTSSSTSRPAIQGETVVNDTVGAFSFGNDCSLVDSNARGALYVSTNATVGDVVCVGVYLSSANGASITITDSAGRVVSSTDCANLTPPGGSAYGPTTCQGEWDTSKPDRQGNAIEPGVYHIVADDGLSANFTLG